MNYITSCPACETQFLLTKDHLKAYRGKVQCGHCEHVFNAKNRLIEVSDDIHTVAEYTAAEFDAAEHASFVDTIDVGDATDFSDADATINTADSAYLVEEKPISEVLNVVLETVPNLSDLGTKSTQDRYQESNSPYISNQTPSAIAEQEIDIDAVRAPIFIDDLTTDPKFQLSKPKRNPWAILVVILLVIIAILQSIYFLRSTIAVHYPPLKPYLEQACQYLNCKISLPQQLNLLTIDDSDMQENDDYQDVINFSSLLINNAPHAQAYPNIELTLTDIDDKPVLRKLVRPQEYLSKGISIADGLQSGEELRIQLAINVQNLSVAGYRVLLTY